MFSALSTTNSLPSTSSTLPLRTELAITLTIDPPRRALLAPLAAAAGPANQLALSTSLSRKRQGATQPLPSEPQQHPWWHPDTHADRRPLLAARGRIKSA